MKNVFCLLFAITVFSLAPAQTKVGGATLPNTVSFEGEKLILNGAGVREKYWMDMYAGALYLASKSAVANEIVNSNNPAAIKLHMVSNLITSDKLISAINEGFENSTNKQTRAISSEIETFKSYFEEKIRKEDVFDIVYIPSKGVLVYKNATLKGIIKGFEFKKALFGIWLSDKPADKNLKQAMLGTK
jgi:hypothetical protein